MPLFIMSLQMRRSGCRAGRKAHNPTISQSKSITDLIAERNANYIDNQAVCRKGTSVKRSSSLKPTNCAVKISIGSPDFLNTWRYKSWQSGK